MPLFRPLIFTIFALGLWPRYSLERSDSGEVRIEKIIGLFSESRFGIHDLSRCQANAAGEMFRLNMPLELGLDLGARTFGGVPFAEKRILILEEERYRFQKAISDISNSDIKAHLGQPAELVRVVRDRLVHEAKAPPLAPTHIWYRFNDFMGENYDAKRKQQFTDEDIERLPIHELASSMKEWIKRNPLTSDVS